ncbi:MAG: four helix bundle protein [Melioribacteraceae bacterium]|nr:four helix bundle protein [Melioribacteraceae bacterium]
MSYKDFTQMSVWQKGFQLIKKIYPITKLFPSDERFGMISDMRRAANSITQNITEGFGRFEARDKTRFYKISRGSAYEIIPTMKCL